MTKRTIAYVLGALILLFAILPPVSASLALAVCLIPILVFGTELALSYTKQVKKGRFFCEEIYIIISALALLIGGNPVQSALLLLLASIAFFFFKKAARTSVIQSDLYLPKRAVLKHPAGDKLILTKEIVPGNIIEVKEGDIVPCDGIVMSGEGLLDYTNIYGPGEPFAVKFQTTCHAGGILQQGNITVKCSHPIENSLYAMINAQSKNRLKASAYHSSVKTIGFIFKLAFTALAIVATVICGIVTKKAGMAINFGTVLLIGASTISLERPINTLYRNAMTSLGKKGGIISSESDLEALAQLKTVYLAQPPAQETLARLEELRLSVLKKDIGLNTNAVCFTAERELRNYRGKSLPVALGFFSPKAGAVITDGNVQRLAGVVRSAKNFKILLTQNIICTITEKLLIILLLFCVTITPAAALVIEFALWMLCILNASRLV